MLPMCDLLREPQEKEILLFLDSINVLMYIADLSREILDISFRSLYALNSFCGPSQVEDRLTEHCVSF